jgi:hypothetical protein
VDRAFAVGSNIELQQNVKSAMTIGDGLIVGTGSTYATILNTVDATIGEQTNYGFIIGGTGSAIFGGDYVGILNGNRTIARDSDFTTIINGHPEDVVLNGNGHVVMNLERAGAGIDLLEYRENSNYLGDTYFGGAQFIEPKTLTCGDGTTINLYDTQYQHDSLFILNWTGFSPGTTTINLPNLTNNDYKKIHYRIKANGTFDGTTRVDFVPFTSPQTIQGFASASFSGSYDYLELYANGTDWLILDSGIGSSATQVTASYALNAGTASYIDPTFISASAAAAGFGGSSTPTFPYTGSAIISGSLQLTGSVSSNIISLTIASNTASVDLSKSNFFEKSLTTSTYIANPTNKKAGSTYSFKFDSGSLISDWGSDYLFSGGTNPTLSNGQDIVTFVSFLSGSNIKLYGTGLDNFS